MNTLTFIEGDEIIYRGVICTIEIDDDGTAFAVSPNGDAEEIQGEYIDNYTPSH